MHDERARRDAIDLWFSMPSEMLGVEFWGCGDSRAGDEGGFSRPRKRLLMGRGSLILCFAEEQRRERNLRCRMIPITGLRR